MNGTLLKFVAAALLALAAALPAAAHDVPGELRVHAYLRAEGERLTVLVRVPLALMLNLDLPKRGNGYVDLALVEQAYPRVATAVSRDIEFYEGDRKLALRASAGRISLPADTSFKSWDEALASIRGPALPVSADVFWNQGYYDAVMEYGIASDTADFAIDFHPSPGLRDRLKLDLRLVTRDGTVRAFELPTGAGKVVLDPRWYQAAWTFVQSGFGHILGGLDHLLFLLCLIVPFRRLSGYLVGVVTAFTLAHSVTLFAAALGVVPTGKWFPPLVETAIAASIVYMAIENVVRPQLKWRWLVTAAFGLVHGFGFSFALANELQFAGSHLVLSLLAFNIGIELGQLLVLVLVWPLLAWVLGKVPGGERVGIAIVSALVAHTAWHWMTERWEALMKAGLPEADAVTLARAAAVALMLVAAGFAWKAVRARRSPAARREAA